MEIYLQGLAVCHGNRTELITHRTLGSACEQPYAYRVAISRCGAEKENPRRLNSQRGSVQQDSRSVPLTPGRRGE